MESGHFLTEAIVNERLSAIGLAMPKALPTPGGAYVPVRVVGETAYVASQFPIEGGKPRFVGALGRELTTSDGVIAARVTALNILAHVHAAVGLHRVRALNRFEAYLVTQEPWDQMPAVLDGASLLFLTALGPEIGQHARAPIGVHRLPWNLPLEITATFTLWPA